MSIRIAQASSSETYGKYGTAPNQRRTGVTASKPEGNLDGELNVIPFSGGWECIYRPHDELIAEKIATFMYKAVANGSHIGYSWSGNTGLYDALIALKSDDPSKVKTLVNCDCASLVGAAIYFSGIKLSTLRTLVTWKMDEILTGSDAFTKLTSKEMCQEGKGIRRGDILWKTGHCAVALDNDISNPRLSLTDSALKFSNDHGVVTGNYTANAKLFLRENDLRTNNLSGNSFYLYSAKGQAVYDLVSDATYLVICSQRNSVAYSNDSVFIVSAHKTNSHLITLTKGKFTCTVNKLKLTIVRPTVYSRISITRVC